MDNLNRKDLKNSPLWRHCVEKHNRQVQPFTMTITGTYRNDAMMRQITEAVQINSLDPDLLGAIQKGRHR